MDIIRVRLRKPRRVLSFLCEGLTIGRDEPCIVNTENGLEWGVCVLPPEPCGADEARRVKMRVVRRATDSDRQTLQDIEEEEAKAQKVCQRRIEKHGLDMKLVESEYAFDKSRMTFHFIAENRVDFRELVRDLAHELRHRIELRHIQVRDQAKMTGGLGTCGRQLCCASFLDDFKPISMRMAKSQNLSLNPAKISGQCGRLLCCLGYENDQYEKCRRQKPEGGQAPCAEAPCRRENPAPAEDGPEPPQPAVQAPVPQGRPEEGDAQPKRKRKKKRRGKKGGES